MTALVPTYEVGLTTRFLTELRLPFREIKMRTQKVQNESIALPMA